jgi:hypothetical protein
MDFKELKERVGRHSMGKSRNKGIMSLKYFCSSEVGPVPSVLLDRFSGQLYPSLNLCLIFSSEL